MLGKSPLAETSCVCHGPWSAWARMASAEGAGRSLTGSTIIRSCASQMHSSPMWSSLWPDIACLRWWLITVSYKEELHLEDEWYKAYTSASIDPESLNDISHLLPQAIVGATACLRFSPGRKLQDTAQ